MGNGGADSSPDGGGPGMDLPARTGRARAAAIADNEAWKAERPGQQKVARSELVATVRAIIE